MEIAAKNSIRSTSIATDKSISLGERFTEYAKSWEDSRVFLMALTVIIHVCILVPATLLVTSFYDKGLGAIPAGLMAACTIALLITNMAELSIKSILISFIISVAMSIALLAIHLL